MFAITIASQCEMFALGVIAKSGPDFFTLFGKETDEKLETTKVVSKGDVAARWGAISSGDEITIDQANAYIAANGNVGLVQRINAFLDRHFNVATDLRKLAMVIVCIAVFKAIALFCSRYFTQVVSIRVSRDMRQQYFEHVQTMPMSFYHEFNLGELGARMGGDAGAIANAINSLLINCIQTPFALLSTLTACILISWKLSLCIFVGFPAVIVPIVFLARRIKRLAKRVQRFQEKAGSVMFEALAGIMTIKIFAMEDLSIRKYRDMNNLGSRLDEKSARYSTVTRPILHTISSILFAMTILVGLYVFQLAPGELLVFCGLLYIFYEPIKKFAEENNNIQRGIAAAERMYEILDRKPSIVDAPDAIEMTSFEDSLEFKNVSFRYQDEWVLRDLSFSVKKGEVVAIVGPTGAGKSTIVQLIPRLYDVQEGEICIDGTPVTKYTQKSLREGMAYVSQAPFLFLDTIKANIGFGRDFSDQEVKEAAERAHAAEFIEKMPGGYNYVLEEMGKNLSGGQKQRMAVARALVKKAPLLIMDEATSSLDNVSEHKVKMAVQSLRGKLTQIIIAHRLSTIEHADKIIYLEEGRKVAEGNKKTLLEICPNFRRMWEMMYATEQRRAKEHAEKEVLAASQDTVSKSTE
ncbi:MAG: Lipid A export ATP-binding/permease protein MsbA [Chlamydiales bacterium]|nr:Lipid A export ATP-binding/permease protein MsbA [Chlamydiales bacterium]MCH9635202.1 Lipid A export ATP-binding/permease protein MsbA [Chlamydiales bacterium]